MEEIKKRGRPKGQTKKGGRVKGTPNRDNRDVKTWINNIITKNYDRLEVDLDEMNGVQRWNFIEKLMSYIQPKQQSINTKINISDLPDETINEICKNL